MGAVLKPRNLIKIGLVGKYAGLTDSYVSMNEAFKHAGAKCQVEVSIDYIESEKLESHSNSLSTLKNYDGIFVPYGFGPRGSSGKVAAIQFARENDIPFLGICYGFQLAVVEFARNVCNLEDADSTEINPSSKFPVIDLMPEQKEVENKGATMRLGSHKISIKKETFAYSLYKSEKVFIL